MTRAYHLIRYIPDPIRGEMVNIAIVAVVDRRAHVLALPATDLARRTFKIAPHVDAGNAMAFLAELTASASNETAVSQLLSVFDPHFRIEEPRRLSTSVDLETTLASAFDALVAQPAKRRLSNRQPRWTLERALDDASRAAPTFGAHAMRHVSVKEHPEIFGLSRDLFEQIDLPNLPAFDAVVPNCVRVLALRGLVVGERTHASTFFETRADLETAEQFFSGGRTTKTVITGALLLPHVSLQLSPATREGMREGLSEVVGNIQIEGIAERAAVFDLSNSADQSYLEQLSAILSRPPTE